MSLRLQLLAFGLLTLALPWAGLRYVTAMETALRSGLEQSLLARAATVAAALEEQAAPLCSPGGCGESSWNAPAHGANAGGDAAPSDDAAAHDAGSRAATIYAAPLRNEPVVDGSRSDWNLSDDAAIALGDDARLWAGIAGRYAFLFVAVEDRDLLYAPRPGETPYGDRVVLGIRAPGGDVRWLLLGTAAPGAFRAQETAPPAFATSDRYDARVIGAWQETAAGYSLEVRVPLALVGAALGVGVIDVDRSGADFSVGLSSTFDAAAGVLGRFVYRNDDLEALARQFGRGGGRIRVLDADGWVLADAGSAEPHTLELDAGWISRAFRWALRRSDPPYPRERPFGRVSAERLRQALAGTATTAWYGDAPDRDAIVAAAVPVASSAGPVGAVLVEQASDPILTLTNRALVRLMSFTLLASVAAALGLVGYATWLQVRLHRLALAAGNALGPKGEIRTVIPGVGARDEIGELARSFKDLLARLREHTDYLKTLASKLSHELRTPLAVVTTSLDNLEHEAHGPASAAYLSRLRQGAARLDAILAAMSEATELERAIHDTKAEPFDLGAVVSSCCRAYRDVYPSREIEWRVTARATQSFGSGELAAQLLDKLVDNAVDFSAEGTRIEVELADAEDDALVLRVTNRGPRLPIAMRGRLFDSLVSIRERRDGKPHLGLGLHIVALIAEFHGGRADAADLPDGSGVTFSVRFARAPRAGAALSPSSRPK